MNVLLTEEESVKTNNSIKSTGATSSSISSSGQQVIEGRGGGRRGHSVAAEADVLFSTTAGIMGKIKMTIKNYILILSLLFLNVF